jgi:hypothetical protein
LQELFPFLAMITDNAEVNKMGFSNLAKVALQLFSSLFLLTVSETEPSHVLCLQVIGPNLYWTQEANAFDLTAIDKACAAVLPDILSFHPPCLLTSC